MFRKIFLTIFFSLFLFTTAQNAHSQPWVFAVSNTTEGGILYDLSGKTAPIYLQIPETIGDILANPDFTKLYRAASDNDDIYITNLVASNLGSSLPPTNALVYALPDGTTPEVGHNPKMVMTEDGSRIYLVNDHHDEGVLVIIETTPVGQLDRIVAVVALDGVGAPEGSPQGVAVTPDGSRVYVAIASGAHLPMDEAGEDTYDDDGDPATAEVPVPAGVAVYDVATDSFINFADADATEPNYIIDTGGTEPRSMVFNSDGTRLFVLNDEPSFETNPNPSDSTNDLLLLTVAVLNTDPEDDGSGAFGGGYHTLVDTNGVAEGTNIVVDRDSTRANIPSSIRNSRIGSQNEVREMVINNDGSTIYLVTRVGRISSIDTATYAVEDTFLELGDIGGINLGMSLAMNPLSSRFMGPLIIDSRGRLLISARSTGDRTVIADGEITDPGQPFVIIYNPVTANANIDTRSLTLPDRFHLQNPRNAEFTDDDKEITGSFASLVISPEIYTTYTDTFGLEENRNTRLNAYYDLRNRQSHLHIANTGADTNINVQVFRHGADCATVSVNAAIAANASVVYNMSEIDGVSAGDYGYVVVTAVDDNGNIDVAGDLIGSFRIIDNAGYEYRTNMQRTAIVSTQNFNYIANFNTVFGASQNADVVGFVYSSGLTDASVANVADGLTFNVALSGLNPGIPATCGAANFACGNVMNYGINGQIRASRGSDLLCSGVGDNSGIVWFTNPTPGVSTVDDSVTFAGYIGLNNGNGTGSMDSWIQADATNAFGRR